jgi:hypothetical protein
MPARRWVWQQSWQDLCFLHFEAGAAELRTRLPRGLELDLFDGKAWVGIVPFRMAETTRRGLPTFAPLSDFPELNVRTYVTTGGKPGVWFFSLDAGNRLAVWLGRSLFHLPYRHAQFHLNESDGACDYRMTGPGVEFAATYTPLEPAPSVAGSFEHWATERYCLYCADQQGALWRAEVQHPKWPLQRAKAIVLCNTVTSLKLGPQHPAVLFSKRIDVVVWPLERVEQGA